jgi:hypothetical protein
MGTMPPNPEKSNTILRRCAPAPNELAVEVSTRCGRSAKTVEPVIRGHITFARVTAVVAAVRNELRIPKPEAAEC